jgi:hypothetical protein
MGGWWGWVKWTLYYLVAVVILLAVYSQIIQTRFESVAFSLLALIYVEQIAEYSAWSVELLNERDHRNEIHRLIAERLDKPLSDDMTTAIKELSGQTIKIRRRHEIHSFGRFLLWLIILWNLFKAVFI